MRLNELARLIDAVAPFELAEPWDNVGLQIGSPLRSARHVMFALEITPAVIKEAARKKADTLITHHPLIFKPMKQVDESVAVHKLVAEMIRHGLSMIAAHTNLDASPRGTNAVLAEMIGLKFDGPLFPARLKSPRPGREDERWGLGAKVRLTKPLTLETLAHRLKRAVGCPAVSMVGEPRRKVRQIAICTGAGTEIVRMLPPGEFDALITGEINHHGALDAATAGLAVLCGGHFETEAPAMARLAQIIAAMPEARGAKLKISISKAESSPIKVVR